MSRPDNAVETVNAAATAIVSAANRVHHITLPRRRWGACFGAYWCFGSPRHDKRISHSALLPEPILSGSNAALPENSTHLPALTLPFIAPPSSPASFLQSESPSAIQSPAGVISFSAFSESAFSPTGPASIFAIGPYAHDTQLVSPPVFSTFTTEPSTASFTPPPEPVQLTTPSSPEVPFAKFLASSLNTNCKKGEVYEFPSYQLYPGSPIGHLISPSSVCSGTSSPLPDLEFHSSGGSSVPKFPIGEPLKILSAEDLAVRKLVRRHASQVGGSPLDTQIPAMAIKVVNDESGLNHRVSFDLTAEEIARCMEKKQVTAYETAQESEVLSTAVTPESGAALCVTENYHDLPRRPCSSVSLTAVKEFKFANSDGTPTETSIGPDWWANEKVSGAKTVRDKDWVFFPRMQPEVG